MRGRDKMSSCVVQVGFDIEIDGYNDSKESEFLKTIRTMLHANNEVQANPYSQVPSAGERFRQFLLTKTNKARFII